MWRLPGHTAKQSTPRRSRRKCLQSVHANRNGLSQASCIQNLEGGLLEFRHFLRGSDGDSGMVGPGRPNTADEHLLLGHSRQELAGRPLGVKHKAVAHTRYIAELVLLKERENIGPGVREDL